MVNLRDLIGKPYAVHGRGPESYDCFGLAIEVCRRYGKKLEDSFYNEITVDMEKRLIDDTKAAIHAVRLAGPAEGAVVEFLIAGKPRHIGVCIGEGKFIHATEKFGVMSSELSSWSKRIEGFYTWQ